MSTSVLPALDGRLRRLVCLLGFGAVTMPVDLVLAIGLIDAIGAPIASAAGWTAAVALQAIAHYWVTLERPGRPLFHGLGYAGGRLGGGLLRIATVVVLVGVGVGDLEATLVGVGVSIATGLVTLDWLAGLSSP